MNKAQLILNAGSSSLIFAVNSVAHSETSSALQKHELHTLFRGSIEDIGPDARFRVMQAPASGALGLHKIAAKTHEQALHMLLDWLAAQQPTLALHAAGHRVVHGGDEFRQPDRIVDTILSIWTAPPTNGISRASVNRTARFRSGSSRPTRNRSSPATAGD